MLETTAQYKNAKIKMYVDVIDHFPWFVNLPTSFTVPKHTIFYEIYRGSDQIAKIASPIAIKVHWFEEPEFKKIENNLAVELKNYLRGKFEPEEIDFIVKTIISFGMGIQSVDVIKTKKIIPVYYSVKDGDIYRVFLLGKEVGKIKFECRDNECDVFLDGEKIDELYIGDVVKSKYPQIVSFIESYVSTMWGELDNAFFEFLSKKYIALLQKYKNKKS